MRRALRRAARVLAAASALGLARPAPAQPPVYSPAPTAPAVVAAMGGGTPLTAAHARLAEMKVELAWLADATTFPYLLGAHTTGAALEVRGYVANEAIKARALEVARKHTALPVADALKVYPGLFARTAGVPAQTLEKMAAWMLADKMGERARAFEVKAQGDGQITVAGSVLSVEEKLAVSRCLRRLRGCTAVVNRLAVVPIQHEGRMLTRVTADGKQVVDGRVLTGAGNDPDPTLLRQAPPASDARTIRLPAPTAASSPGYSLAPPASDAWRIRLPSDSSRTVEGGKSSQPAATAAAPPVSQVSAVAPAPAPAARQAQGLQPLGLVAPAPAAPGAAWALVESAYAPADRPPAPGKQPNGGDLPALSPGWWGPPGAAAPRTRTMTAVGEPPAPATGSASPYPTTAGGSGPASPEGGAETPYATKGVVLMEEESQPVLLSRTTALAMTRLRQRVKMVCGRRARDVQVIALPDQGMRVVVRVEDEAVEKQLRPRIMELPELASPAVELEMQTPGSD